MPIVRRSPGSGGLVRACLLAAAGLLVPAGLLGAEGVPAEWSYEGATGPEEWGDLAPAYTACGEGTAQSPIDIPADAPVLADDLSFAYVAAPATVVDNGHAIQVGLTDAGTIEDDGRTYALRQFHFHAPSEHSLDGREFPMELHMVHVGPAGALGVVGVLVVEGAENEALAPIWAALPTEPEVPVTLAEPVDAGALLPVDLRAVSYAGSLTTPPCTEGVAWHVLIEPIELSAEQIGAYRTIHDDTDRPTQPLDGRTFEDS